MNKVKILFLFLLFGFIACTDEEIDNGAGWNGSARKWEHLEGGYRGFVYASVDGIVMDTIIQQALITSDDYDNIRLIVSNLRIQSTHYGNLIFSKLQFQELASKGSAVTAVAFQGEQTLDNGTLGMLKMKIEGKIVDGNLTFSLNMQGLQSLAMQLEMPHGRYMKKLPSSLCNVTKMGVSEEPFITGTPDISGNMITFYVADTLRTTDSTYFTVLPKFELSPGAWVEADTIMSWKLNQSTDEETPSVITTDSVYRFNSKNEWIPLKVWANDSINYRMYYVRYARSKGTTLPLFKWENVGDYSNPIDGWTSNNAYLHSLLKTGVLTSPSMYVKRVLGYNVGDTGARLVSDVIGSVEDSTIQVVAGRLFRGSFEMDSLETPKKGELHGVGFKGKPVTLRGYFKYLPGEKLFVQDSIVPDSIRTQTDSCLIEAFLYEAPLATSVLDSITDFAKDPKIVAHGRFTSGKCQEFMPFAISFTVRNWLPTKRYHMGIICTSSAKTKERVGSPGSTLTVSSFEVMSSTNVYE
ncbi:MAG: PCMD domain-containing protein [Marinifilaceae bacterium]